MIDPFDGQILNTADPADTRLQTRPGLIDTQMALMTSRPHVELVMRELGLLEVASAKPEPTGPRAADSESQVEAAAAAAMSTPPAPLQWLAAYLPESWLMALALAQDRLQWLAAYLPEGWLAAAGLAQDAVLSAPPVVDPEQLKDAAIDRFRQDLEVSRDGLSMVITVSYSATDPERAAQVANAVAYVYVDAQLQGRRQAAERAADWLDERLEELRETVRRSEQAATEFRIAQGLFGTAARTSTEQEMLELRRQLSGVRGERMVKEAKLRRARELQASQQDLDVLAIVGSPLIASLRLQEALLLREEAELAQTYGGRHPRMISLRAQIAEIRSKIREEADRALRSLEDELAMLRGGERALLDDLQEVEREQNRNQQNQVRLAEFERQAEANGLHYEALLRRSKATQEQEKALQPQARVISPAVPPRRPSTPGPRVFATVGFTVSAMLGVFLALVLERVDSRVRSAEGLGRAGLGVPVLGLMPRLPSRRAWQRPARYIARNPLSEVTESAHSILTTVGLDKASARSSVLLVTSALPKEGKTTLAIALAAAAAASDHKVLLVDLDLRRPMVDKRLLERPRRPGLAEYLTGSLPREELVQRDPDSGLHFIPAGRPPDYPLMLIQSPELRELVDAARRDYDYVILDSAPLLAVVEARVATRLADRIVLASRWRQTHTEAVAQAVRVLLQIQAEIAGSVLTDVVMRKYRLFASTGGSYSYHGHYRDYYTD